MVFILRFALMFNEGKLSLIILFLTALFYALIYHAFKLTLCSQTALFFSLYLTLSSLLISYFLKHEYKKLKSKTLIQNARIKSIFDTIPFCMYIKKIDGTILKTNYYLDNKKFRNLNPKLAGTNARNLYKDYSICVREDSEILKYKRCIIKERFVETINGSLGWCRIIKAPVLDSNGEIDNIAVIFQNIDDEKEINDRKSTFIATLTHDLKTPTFAQINALNLLLKNPSHNLNDSQKDLIKLIKNSCKYMHDLIYTISDTYLYDNGQAKIHYEKFDLTKLCLESIKEVSNLLSAKHQQIHFRPSSVSKYIIADRCQLKRVILNLISNAITYGCSNSIVEIFIKDKHSNLNLSVRNKTNYMPDGKLINLFDKFKTASNAKFFKTSSGLGLYLSKQIISAHKGKVFASGNNNKFLCTFGFSIPKKPEKYHSLKN